MGQIFSFSGPPGAGKTPCASYVSSQLYQAGYPVYYLKFRKTSFKSFLLPKEQITEFEYDENFQGLYIEPHVRRTNYKLKSATWLFLKSPFFLIRVLLFHLLIFIRFRKDIVLLDRYVYDSMVHYRIDNFVSRLFLRLIAHPNIPFFIHGDIDEITKNKTEHSNLAYDREYLRISLKGYRKMFDTLRNLGKRPVLIDGSNVEIKIKETYSVILDYLKNVNGGS